MEDIAYLVAVAVYGNGASLQHGVKEMRNPTLVLIAELPRTGDAGHAEDNRSQIVDARIIADVLIGSSFGTAVRRMEIEWFLFVYTAKARTAKP